MEYRERKAKELCKLCRVKGLPGIRFTEHNKQGVYIHKFMDAAGSLDWEPCDASHFLMRLDAFLCSEDKTWKS